MLGAEVELIQRQFVDFDSAAIRTNPSPLHQTDTGATPRLGPEVKSRTTHFFVSCGVYLIWPKLTPPEALLQCCCEKVSVVR